MESNDFDSFRCQLSPSALDELHAVMCNVKHESMSPFSVMYDTPSTWRGPTKFLSGMQFDPVSHSTTFSATKHMKNTKIVLNNREILLECMSFLHLQNMIVLKRINKWFYNLLGFDFIIDYKDKNGYFYYNHSKLKKLLIDQLLSMNGSLVNLVAWYCQSSTCGLNVSRSLEDPLPDMCPFIHTTHYKCNYNSKYKKCDSVSAAVIERYIRKYFENHSDNRKLTQALEDETKCIFKIINPLQACYTQLNTININMDVLEYWTRDKLVDIGILSNLYSITPLENLFNQILMKNKAFQYKVLCGDESCRKYYICNLDRDMYRYFGNRSHFIWSLMEDINIKTFFPYFTDLEIKLKGQPCLFAALSCKGDFNHYTQFQNTQKTTVMQDGINRLRECDLAMRGQLGVISLFLRSDLLKTFNHHNTIVEIVEMCLCLIDPGYYLKNFKSILVNHLFIPLSADNLKEFDIINNPRYFPENRLKFLRDLCFCSVFLQSFVNCGKNITDDKEMVLYLDLHKVMTIMYNNFEQFVLKWRLNEYTHLQNNIWKQTRLFYQFKVVMQALFAMSQLVMDFNAPTRHFTLKKSLKCIVNGNPVHDGYIDLFPRDKDDMKNIYNTMTDGRTTDEVKNALYEPCFHSLDISFNEDSVNSFVFDCVSDLQEFFQQLVSLN